MHNSVSVCNAQLSPHFTKGRILQIIGGKVLTEGRNTPLGVVFFLANELDYIQSKHLLINVTTSSFIF